MSQPDDLSQALNTSSCHFLPCFKVNVTALKNTIKTSLIPTPVWVLCNCTKASSHDISDYITLKALIQ